MCSVSAVSQYYTETFPQRHIGQPLGGLQTPVVHTFDAETKDLLRQALKLLDRIDKKLGDVECMDGAKAEMLKALQLDPGNISGG